jgi:NYN domain
MKLSTESSAMSLFLALDNLSTVVQFIETGGTMVKVAVLVDTPNIGKSVQNKYTGYAWPDYKQLRQLVGKYGLLTKACALVNDGVNRRFISKLASEGFEVRLSHAFDCDDALVAWAVRLRQHADCIVLCSGDKHYIPLVQLLIATGMKIVICAVEGCCNGTLRRIAGAYEEMPIR